jgi:hypothetical protein
MAQCVATNGLDRDPLLDTMKNSYRFPMCPPTRAWMLFFSTTTEDTFTSPSNSPNSRPSPRSGRALSRERTRGRRPSSIGNHDNAHTLNRFGNTPSRELWSRSAKTIALWQATLTTTLLLYQGQVMPKSKSTRTLRGATSTPKPCSPAIKSGLRRRWTVYVGSLAITLDFLSNGTTRQKLGLILRLGSCE